MSIQNFLCFFASILFFSSSLFAETSLDFFLPKNDQLVISPVLYKDKPLTSSSLSKDAAIVCALAGYQISENVVLKTYRLDNSDRLKNYYYEVDYHGWGVGSLGSSFTFNKVYASSVKAIESITCSKKVILKTAVQ